VQTRAESSAGAELVRAWWLRALLVLQSPRAVFAAVRDDSDGAARARQDPVAAVAGLAGIAFVLATPVARRLANDPDYDGIVIAVWAFLGGIIYAVALYWVLGALLHGSARALGSRGSYRRARHVLGLAAAPLALSLVLYWPVRIAVYGQDLFRTGGTDYGRGDTVFGWIFLGVLAWCLALLLVGVRTVHGWSWGRAAAAVALAAALPTLLVLASSL
jgi:hypothetical protein